MVNHGLSQDYVLVLNVHVLFWGLTPSDGKSWTIPWIIYWS
jgi:hypothetical protein